MKLTKEECLNELEILCNYADMSASGEFVGKMLQEADDTLHQLINEYFELVEESKASYSKFLHNISKLESEITLLKRENKALADDNEMKCELNEKLSKEVAELKRMMKTFK